MAKQGFFGSNRRIVSKYFRDVTNDPVERKVFLENRSRPRFKFTVERRVRRAKELERISDLFENADLPIQRVLLRESNLTAQNYITGRALNPANITRGQLCEVARIVAGMHAILPTKRLSPPDKGEIERKLQVRSVFLEQKGILTKAEAARIHAVLSTLLNSALHKVVLSHNDVTGNNIRIHRGKIHLIDLGDSGLAFREIDLARTIFNFGLSPAKEKIFLDAYRRNGGDTNAFVRNRSKWLAYVAFYKLFHRVKENRSNAKIQTAQEKLLACMKKM